MRASHVAVEVMRNRAEQVRWRKISVEFKSAADAIIKLDTPTPSAILLVDVRRNTSRIMKGLK